MLRVVLIVVLFAVLSKGAKTGRSSSITPYPSRWSQLEQPVAEDRKYHWIKGLKKEKFKFKKFERYIKRCGVKYPLKFKLFRRSDDGDVDTIHVMVPYGYSDEYFPKTIIQQAPEEYHSESTTPRFVYSVKYRDAPIDWSNTSGNLGTIYNSSVII